ncbi:MAG: ribokinase [Colwellia sp.]|nr:ribokinase [Colwellia sp.]
MNIVVIGSTNVDMIIKVPRIPRPGETILGDDFSSVMGGKGANQAVAAARSLKTQTLETRTLGKNSQITFVSRVGNDIYGKQAITGFNQDNINTTYIQVDEHQATGIALINVSASGENSISVASGANAKLSIVDIEASRDVIEQADVVLMQLETPLESIKRAAEIAKSANVRVILNPAPAPIEAIPDDILRLISTITPNETETFLLTGVEVTDLESADLAAQVLLDKGLETVILTLGDRGAFIKTKKISKYVAGFKVNAIDTTAAGDVFNGAYTVAIAEGNTLEDAVRFANAAAALSVTKFGAQPSVHKRQEIDKFLLEQIQ